MSGTIDVPRAIAYAEKQAYTREQIQTIQRVSGSAADGVLGPKTIQAISTWQARVGLRADGMAGPETWRAIQRFAGLGHAIGTPKLGVWVDDQPKTVLGDGWLARLAGLGFSTVAIMVQRSTSAHSTAAWSARWTTAQLATLRKLAEPLGLDVVLTTWPLPDKGQLVQMREVMPALLESAGAVGFEVDTEGNWDASRLSGFASMADAAAALVETMQSVAHGKLRLELTTYPYHAENDSKALIAPHMHRLFPQAYSVAVRRGKPVPYTDRLGPGSMQALSVHRAETIPGVATTKITLGLGLAAYDQAFTDHSPAQAMAAALEAATLQRVPEVRYWSSRWILGSSANAQIMSFFAERAGRSRPPLSFGAPLESVDHDDDAIESMRGDGPTA